MTKILKDQLSAFLSSLLEDAKELTVGQVEIYAALLKEVKKDSSDEIIKLLTVWEDSIPRIEAITVVSVILQESPRDRLKAFLTTIKENNTDNLTEGQCQLYSLLLNEIKSKLNNDIVNSISVPKDKAQRIEAITVLSVILSMMPDPMEIDL